MVLLRSIIIVVLLTTLHVSHAEKANIGFSGSWCWNKDSKDSAFSITINRVSNIYKGGYYSVALRGNIIDDNEDAFSFKVSENKIVKVKIKSGIDGAIGIIQLKILNDKKIEWRVLQVPEGDFYPPLIAILNKCNG